MAENSHDVIVVGAGPAGCTAARVTAAAGLKTLVVDRRRKIGVPIHCGEFLPTAREMRDLLRESPRASRLVDIPNDLITNRTNRLMLVSPLNNEFSFKLDSRAIDRTKFDQYLANRAEDAGAEIALKSTAIERSRSNTLIVRQAGRKVEMNARVVIGADGPSSIISKSIGNQYYNPGRDLCPSLNYVITEIECDSKTTEMYFGNHIAPGGYAWIIPKGDRIANVGFGMRKPFGTSGVPLKQYLRRFIESHPLVSQRTKKATIVSRVGAIIPVGGPVDRTYSENVVLVGDAAGHVMACNGGGVPTALVGGEIAGESVVTHLTDGVSLASYEDTWRKEIGKELYTALRILRIADQVMPSDRITDQCMRLAGPRYLKHLIRCRLPIPVDFASKTLVKVLSYIE
ncbi:MAG: geranylgeranyl reductase family protein [Candidatus Thorarchaeota archaeon]|jgi:digeranylgeranylglycerophospholipid reductase